MQIIDPTPDGSSAEKAIIVNEKSEIPGVSAEYSWLQKHYPGYKLSLQLVTSIDNKSYDIILINTSDGQSKKVYFDISDFQGNF